MRSSSAGNRGIVRVVNIFGCRARQSAQRRISAAMNRKSTVSLKRTGFVVSTLACILLATGANASGVLEEVKVTAQKREESVQSVPIAITALTRDALEKLKLRTANEIVASVPNVSFNGNGADYLLIISIRGVSMQDYSNNQAGPIAIYEDEVYRGVQVLAAGIQLYDIERVEVLRGPQGTLYGRNSTGGAINFITRKPQFAGQSGYVTIGTGDYGRKEVQGAYDAELVKDQLGMRFAFNYLKTDGYVKNRLPGKNDLSSVDEWGGRLIFTARPSDNLEASLTLEKTRQTPHSYGALTIETNPYGIGFGGYRRDDRLGFWESETDYAKNIFIDFKGAALKLDWQTAANLTVTSITAYDKGKFGMFGDDDGSPLNILHDDYVAHADQFSQELRLTSQFDGRFNFVGGLYYVEDKVDAYNIFRYMAQYGGVDNFCLDDPFFFIGCRYDNEYVQKRDSYAAFVHTTTDLSERLKLNAGLRYTRDSVRMSNYKSFMSDVLTGVSNPAFGGAPFPIFDENPGKKTETNTSGKVGLDYQLTDDAMVYVSYSTGYRVGAWNGLAFFFPSEITYADPEKVKALEGGFKTQWLDRRLQLNGALFTYDYTNQQFINFDPNTGAQTIQNAKKAASKGFEVEFTYLPADVLQLSAGIGYLDTKYKKLIKGGLDLSGNKLIAAPKWNINTAIDFNVPFDSFNVTLHADGVYTSKQFYSPENLPAIAQDAYWIWNARAELENKTRSLVLGLWIKNIAKKNYVVNAYDLTGFGYNFYQRGVPRTYGVDLTWHF